MPTTFWTFAISTGALIGIFPLAGFWSKDEILAGSAQGQEQGYTFMLVMGLVGAFCTAAYMTRAMWKTFFGEYRGHAHPHESPKVMTVPLVLLCAGAVTFGFLNIPSWFSFLPDSAILRFEHYVEPTFAFPENIEHPSFSWPIALASTLIAALGIFLAYSFFALGKSPFKGLSQRQPFAFGYKALENKYGLDILYTDKIVGGTKGPIARAAYWINMNIIDKVVNAVGVGARRFGDVLYRYVDQGVVDAAVNASGTASEESGQLLRRVQTGKVQQYAAMLFGGAVLFAFFLVLFV
jgi:NADH-quinone oxidoreductase subunit L